MQKHSLRKSYDDGHEISLRYSLVCSGKIEDSKRKISGKNKRFHRGSALLNLKKRRLL